MSLINLLNLCVGLILAWLLVSLVVMQLQEWLVARYQLRAKMLSAAVTKMLGGVLAHLFYQHPIIQSLAVGKDKSAMPSYIPSEQFAAVVMDLVRALGNETTFLHEQIQGLCWTLENKRQSKSRRAALPRLKTLLNLIGAAGAGQSGATATGKDLGWAISELQKIATDFPTLAPDIQALEDAHRNAAGSIGPGSSQSASVQGIIQETRAGLAALVALDPGTGKSLRVMFSSLDENANQPENALATARQSLQNWFESAMDRLNGRYKRRAIVVSFVLGFALAVAVNIDSIALAGFLWRQAYIADQIAKEAQALLSSVSNDPSKLGALGQAVLLQSRLAAYNLPLGWIGLPISPDASVTLANLRQICGLNVQGSSAIRGVFVANQCFPLVNVPQTSDYPGWLVKVVGCVITAAAAAQGAPFWFDILAKLINVRSSGIKPSPAAGRVG
jgi:hypothetical protein